LPTTGGVDLAAIDYAIGADNHLVIARRAAASETALIKVNPIRLYDVGTAATPTSPMLVSAMTSGRRYAVVLDVTSSNPLSTRLDENFIEGYTSAAMDESVIASVVAAAAGSVEAAEIFLLDVSTTDNKVTLGWNAGDLNVQHDFLVLPAGTEVRPLKDENLDRIPDSIDRDERTIDRDNSTALPVDIEGSSGNVLTASYPTFVSDEGLIIAAALGADDIKSYSAANINYAELSTETRATLAFADSDITMQIEKLVTFGVSDVPPTAAGEGGVARITFPISKSNDGAPLYVGKYDYTTERWKRFERGTADGAEDTWYAIARPQGMDADDPSDDGACPQELAVYRNNHRAAGMESQGFEAGDASCIMLVISDGGPYDKFDTMDGRVIDPTAFFSVPLQDREDSSVQGIRIRARVFLEGPMQ